MILKPIQKSLKLRSLEALVRRLSRAHPKFSAVESQLSRAYSGYLGEKSIDYYLEMLPDQDIIILHDLRLPYQNYSFQIDILLLTLAWFFILEAKNNGGEIVVDPLNHQLIQTLNGTQKVYPDPLLQIQLQQYQLIKWFKNRSLDIPPIESAVVMTNHHAKLNILQGNLEYYKKIIRSNFLLSKINETNNIHQNKKFTHDEILAIAKLLINAHTPLKPNVLDDFQIQPTEILTGVICPKCATFSMKWKRGIWRCQHCDFTSPVAHIDALKDHALLLGDEITNQQFREFLHIDSPDTAQKMLSMMGFPHHGSNRGRKYVLKFDD